MGGVLRASAVPESPCSRVHPPLPPQTSGGFRFWTAQLCKFSDIKEYLQNPSRLTELDSTRWFAKTPCAVCANAALPGLKKATTSPARPPFSENFSSQGYPTTNYCSLRWNCSHFLLHPLGYPRLSVQHVGSEMQCLDEVFSSYFP